MEPPHQAVTEVAELVRWYSKRKTTSDLPVSSGANRP